MTIQETGEIMEVLSIAYPQFYAKQNALEKQKALVLWQEMFKDYPGQLVAYAVKAFIAGDTKGFPPAIGQIMDRIRMLTAQEELNEAEAWALVQKAIRRSGYYSKEEFAKLPAAAQKAVGTPEQLREWALDPDFNAGVEGSNFKRAYRTECARQKEHDALPEDVKRLVRCAIINKHDCERIPDSN